MARSHKNVDDALAQFRLEYIDNLGQRFEAIDEAWERIQAHEDDEDAHGVLHRLVHNLSGSSGILGLDLLRSAARDLETQLQAQVRGKRMAAKAREQVSGLIDRLKNPGNIA